MENFQEYHGDSFESRKFLKLKTETLETKKDKHGNTEEAKKTQIYTGKRQEPNYVKVYFDDIELLYKLPKNTSSFLYELLPYMNYQGEISINSVMKKRITLKLGLKNEKQLNNYITVLLKNDIVKRVGRGVYIINPYLLAKGKWEDIEGLRVIYKENGEKEIEPIIKGENEND